MMDEVQRLLVFIIGSLAIYIVMFDVNWVMIYFKVSGWIYKKKNRDIWKK